MEKQNSFWLFLFTVFTINVNVANGSFFAENNLSKCYNTTTIGGCQMKDKDIHFENDHHVSLSQCLVQEIYKIVQLKTVVIAEKEIIFNKWNVTELFGNNVAIRPHLSELTDEEIFQHLLDMKARGIRIYVLFCSLKCTINILNMATRYTYMNTNKFLWITFYSGLPAISLDFPVYTIRFVADSPPTNALACSRELLTKLSHVYSPRISFWKPLIASDLSTMADVLQRKILEPITVVTVQKIPYLIIKEVAEDKLESYCKKGKVCLQYIVENNTRTNRYSCCYGLSIDILKNLERDLGMITEIYLVEDGFYGAKKNGQWNGLVADLMKGKAEIALATLTINKERSQAVDFTEPFISESIALVTIGREHGNSIFNFEVFSPFSQLLWISIVILVLLVSFVLVGTEKLGSYMQRNVYPWIESISYITSLLVGADLGAKETKNLSTRVISVMMAIGTLILMSTYTAVLTASLVESHLHFFVTGLRDQKLSAIASSISYGMLANSSYTSFFRDSEDPDYASLFHSPRRHDFKTLKEGMDMLKAGKLQAVINDESVLIDYTCREREAIFKVVGDPIKLIGMAFGIRKSSPLQYEITNLIRQYKTDGLLQELERKWIIKECEKDDNNEVQPANAISFGGAFVLLIFGVVLSFGIFLCEYSFSKFKMQYKKQKNKSPGMECYDKK